MESGFMVVAARGSGNLILLMLAISALILGTAAVKPWERLSEEEKMKLDLQLKIINKPAVKSFQTEYGDIFDCIDINKQLAFDHPLLKNHTIQMKPKSIPRGMEIGTSVKEESSLLILKNIQCQKGYVPIRRAMREDLLVEKYLSSLRISSPANVYSSNDTGLRSAVMEYRGVHYGAKANINIWSPNVSENQLSTATIWITKGDPPQVTDIQAGWIVYPYLYKNYSRLYTYWTADGYQKTGCYNILCPGFVQVSSEIPLGVILKPVSTFDGEQYQMPLSIYQDEKSGNWWLALDNLDFVGYWPKSLLPNLSDGASYIAWGGQVYNPVGEASAAMGSGHFPEERYKKSAYMSQLKLIGELNSYVDPDKLTSDVDEPGRYNITYYVDPDPNWEHTIYYGGPGNCTN